MKSTVRHVTHSLSQADIVAALTTLSRLALRTSTLRAMSPEITRRWTTILLKRLLTLCAAQQGAIFVASPDHHGSSLEAALTSLDASGWSLMTKNHCSEEGASAAFEPFTSTPETFHYSATSPATLCWKRVLPAEIVLTNAASQPPQASVIVAVVLRWQEQFPDVQETETAGQQAVRLLPLLADLVDTILVHLFTAQQETPLPGEQLPTELLATVGHELRGPLTTIQGYAQTLLRYEPQLAPTERQEFLRAISQASTHISLLVNRFLELAQFETHTHVFLPAPVNMRALAQEALTAAQAGRGHRLLLFPWSQTTRQATDQEAPDEDALTIEGDRRLLRWMFDLLLENALAYSAPESLVEVFLEPRTFGAETTQALLAVARHHSALILPATFHEQEPLLEIRVQDHGRGIAPEELAAIFRRFYRRDSSLTREVNGLGLGLTLCQAIVALHRGMLWAESALGEGSTFHLVLPRRQAWPDQDHEEEADEMVDLQHGKETPA